MRKMPSMRERFKYEDLIARLDDPKGSFFNDSTILELISFAPGCETTECVLEEIRNDPHGCASPPGSVEIYR